VKTEVVIAAGGRGIRFGNTQPKQFCPIAGKPIVEWTLDRFEACHLINFIILVVPEGMKKQAEEKLSLSKYRKLKTIVEGGKERTDSVYEGLCAVDEDTYIVLIHDGVRPLVSTSLITSVIQQTKIYGAVVPGVPIKETIKEKSKENLVLKTLSREKLYLIQTPQGFKYELIKNAHKIARSSNLKQSDDAGILEKLGERVYIIPGEEKNIKITTCFDFKLAEMLLKEEQKKI